MRKKLRRWEIAGFLFTAAMGPLLHFAFKWSGYSSLVGAFAAVNESTWEHMKILFVPLFVFTILEFLVFAESYANFFAVKGASALAALAGIPVLYYTINGAFGKTPDFVNIAIYYVAAIAFFLLSFFLLTRGCLCGGRWQVGAFVLFWLLAFLFVYFTYRPLPLPLFTDPLTGTVGMVRQA